MNPQYDDASQCSPCRVDHNAKRISSWGRAVRSAHKSKKASFTYKGRSYKRHKGYKGHGMVYKRSAKKSARKSHHKKKRSARKR